MVSLSVNLCSLFYIYYLIYICNNNIITRGYTFETTPELLKRGFSAKNTAANLLFVCPRTALESKDLANIDAYPAVHRKPTY